MARKNEVDSCVIVMEALMAGLRVPIGDYTFQYDPSTEEVLIVGKSSSGEEVLLRTETLSLNGFIQMVHRDMTEPQELDTVAQLVLKEIKRNPLTNVAAKLMSKHKKMFLND